MIHFLNFEKEYIHIIVFPFLFKYCDYSCIGLQWNAFDKHINQSQSVEKIFLTKSDSAVTMAFNEYRDDLKRYEAYIVQWIDGWSPKGSDAPMHKCEYRVPCSLIGLDNSGDKVAVLMYETSVYCMPLLCSLALFACINGYWFESIQVWRYRCLRCHEKHSEV